MSSKNFEPIDKVEATGILLKHVASNHNLIITETEKLDESSIKITDFLMKVWDDEKEEFTKSKQTDLSILNHQLHLDPSKPKHPIIYQYAMANQHDFEVNMKILSKATSSIYPIIENMQKEIFNTIRPTPQAQPAQGSTNLSVTVPQVQEKESFWKNPFGAKKEQRMENVTDINQYTRSINVIDETLQIPVFLSKYKDYHYHGVTRCMNLYYGNIQAQRNYLANEIRYFHTMVEPKLQHIADEARRLKLSEEKHIIGPILTSARELAERRDFQPQPLI